MSPACSSPRTANFSSHPAQIKRSGCGTGPRAIRLAFCAVIWTKWMGLHLPPDGRTLASRCKDGSIYLWDLAKPSRHLGYRTLPVALIRWPIFTPDSQSILAEDSEPRGGALESLNPQGNAPFMGRLRKSLRPRLLAGCQVGDADRWQRALKRLGRAQRVGDNQLHRGPARVDAPGLHRQREVPGDPYGRVTNLVLQAWDTDTWQPKVSRTLHFKSVSSWFTTPLPNSCVILADGAFQFFDVTKPDLAPRQIVSRGIFQGFEVSPDCRFAAAGLRGWHLFGSGIWRRCNRWKHSRVSCSGRPQSPSRPMAGDLRPAATARRRSSCGTPRHGRKC